MGIREWKYWRGTGEWALEPITSFLAEEGGSGVGPGTNYLFLGAEEGGHGSGPWNQLLLFLVEEGGRVVGPGTNYLFFGGGGMQGSGPWNQLPLSRRRREAGDWALEPITFF